MKPIYFKQDVKLLENLLMKKEHLSTYDLMHRAALGCFNQIQSLALVKKESTLLMLVGSGHNGGDALLLAHHLLPHVASIQIYLMSDEKKYQGDIKKALHALSREKLTISYLTLDTMALFTDNLKTSDMLIDGVYGTGFKHPLNAFLKVVFKTINDHHINVISLDLPSGLHADSGHISDALFATHTLAIGTFKPGHFLYHGRDYCGHIHLVDIGLTKTNNIVPKILIDASYFNQMIPQRKHNTHKYHYGNLLVVGGSIGLMGAPILSACAAYRNGCGLVSTSYTDKTYPHRFQNHPEIMSHILDSHTSLDVLLNKKTGVAFGMGIDQSAIYLPLLEAIINKKVPVIVDAGGLFHLKKLIKPFKDTSIIITPHVKELADFLSISVDDVLANPIELSETLAKQYDMVVCLKGPTTIVTDGRQTLLCPFGNPGLAKAGSGDILSGIIGAYLAQGKTPLDACLLGVYILGASADLAGQTLGEDAIFATDLINHMPHIIKTLKASST